MNRFRVAIFAAAAGIGSMLIMAPKAQAQVSVSIGEPPVCPYGYYDVAPYACAPAGYYGPEWFTDGVFIGAGPWFHGPHDFHGYVDNHFHPDARLQRRRCRSVAKRRNPERWSMPHISMATKCGMDEATRWLNARPGTIGRDYPPASDRCNHRLMTFGPASRVRYSGLTDEFGSLFQVPGEGEEFFTVQSDGMQTRSATNRPRFR